MKAVWFLIGGGILAFIFWLLTLGDFTGKIIAIGCLLGGAMLCIARGMLL